MQIKVTAYFVLFTCLVSSLMGKTLYRKGCFECEEEEWEEVPCENIPLNATTENTSPPPVFRPTVRTTTTQLPSTSKVRPFRTPAPGTTSPPTARTTESTTPKDPYKKCYCECKLGCKEFCRKVILNPTEKQIVQVSKISEPVNKGSIVTTHILQRELVPKSEQNYRPASDNYNSEPVMAAIEPIYDPYAGSEEGANNINLFDSYPPLPRHSSLYSAPISVDTYNFPMPLENVFSKVSKNVLNPIQTVQISPHAPGVKDEKADARTLIGSPQASLDNVDDSLATFLREVIGNNPTNEALYQSYPTYSVSYNR